ncbi:hypothetical protein AMTR_s00174p00051560 [Amborella trichopoda]|uniref:Bifunctional inhibitor/plant lipid transfer protein/seed storage helical domain-containing protein n=2 Tax=Amborella trichopoda TaxID=13333 RepID=U5D294_AMBTC|nr:hypothetical protein AMTR_s00174p00051560 [Amborella trichopoda]
MAQIRASGLVILAMVLLSAFAAHAQVLDLCARVNVALDLCQVGVLGALLPNLIPGCCTNLQALAALSVGPQRKECCQCFHSYLLNLDVLVDVNLFNQCGCNFGFPLDRNFDCNS